MVRFLASTTLALIGNALGLIVASLVLDDMALDAQGFVIALLIFSIAYIVMQPLSVKMALRYASALAGGSALVATLLSLIITDVLADGLSIKGFTTWVLATVIIWLISVLAALILPLFLFRKALGRGGPRPANPGTTWR